MSINSLRLQQIGDLAKAFPRVHFVGIGGVGMSGIAEVLCTLGYQVSGSDNADNAVTRRLASLGASISKGHAAANVLDADCIVVSSAIKPDNPEMDPTFVIGGQLLAAGANARLGDGQWLVAEADESDGSFLRLSPAVAIVTNIDADHLENYGGDFEQVKRAFSEFLHRLPFYGLAVLCIDDAEVAALAANTSRHVVTYGFAEHADVRAEEVSQQGGRMHYTLCLPDGSRTACTLALPGKHNVQNALAASAVAWQLGVANDAIARALQNFAGIGRRFNQLAKLPLATGGDVVLVDDYGHHPKELAAVFEAARGGWADKRLVVAFQPHRYSRTRDLFDEFAAVLSTVDALVLTEVYPAGEAPIAGADAKSLARSIRTRGRVDPVVVGSAGELADALVGVLRDGDLLLMMGAGDIGAAAQQIARTGLQGDAP